MLQVLFESRCGVGPLLSLQHLEHRLDLAMADRGLRWHVLYPQSHSCVTEYHLRVQPVPASNGSMLRVLRVDRIPLDFHE